MRYRLPPDLEPWHPTDDGREKDSWDLKNGVKVVLGLRLLFPPRRPHGCREGHVLLLSVKCVSTAVLSDDSTSGNIRMGKLRYPDGQIYQVHTTSTKSE